MKKILRAADQTEMRDIEFREFLLDRGYSEEKIKKLKNGEKTSLFLPALILVVLMTGYPYRNL